MIDINKPYVPAVAERGKFAPIDPETLQSLGYSTSGEGRYAIFTYDINPPIINIDGAEINIDHIDVDNWNDFLDASQQNPLHVHIATHDPLQVAVTNLDFGDIDLDLSAGVNVNNLNELSSIEVSNLNELSSIEVSNLNELSSISINNFDELSSIEVSNLNELSSIEVSNLNELSSIEVSNLNELSSIEVSNLNELSSIEVSNLNELSSIEVSNLNELSSIEVSNLNELSSIEVSNLNELSSIEVSNLNELSAISVTNFEELTGIALRLAETAKIPSVHSIDDIGTSAAWEYTLTSTASSFDVEIFNRTSDVLYYLPIVNDGAVSNGDFHEYVIDNGIPLARNSYYANTRLGAISLASETGGNVRIVIREQ